MREYTTPAVTELPPDTRLTDTVFVRAAEEPDAVMFRRLDNGQWRDVTCAEFHRDVMGIAKALIDLVSDQAEDRGWAKLVLNAPRQSLEGRRLFERLAAPSDWTSHVIRYDAR